MPHDTAGLSEYPFVLYQDELTDGSFCWVAEHPDLDGVHGYGRTQTEAVESLAAARTVYLRGLKRLGGSPPRPTVTFRQAVVDQSSGEDCTSPGWPPASNRKNAVALGANTTDARATT